MGVAAVAIAVAHPAFGSQVAAQGVVAVALAVVAHAVETPAGGSAQQAVERIITKSLRLREAHLEILDHEHVAGCAISITQILQRAGVAQRPAHQLLQSPALGSPGVIAILALRLVGSEYALGECAMVTKPLLFCIQSITQSGVLPRCRLSFDRPSGMRFFESSKFPRQFLWLKITSFQDICHLLTFISQTSTD